METIEDINVALLQLRENLANLDAARLQVAQVTGSSQELVEATARLSDEVKRLADRISEETQASCGLDELLTAACDLCHLQARRIQVR